MTPVPITPPVPITLMLLLLRATTAIGAVPLLAVRATLAAAAALAIAIAPAPAPPSFPAPAATLTRLTIPLLGTLFCLCGGVARLRRVGLLVGLFLFLFLLDVGFVLVDIVLVRLVRWSVVVRE